MIIYSRDTNDKHNKRSSLYINKSIHKIYIVLKYFYHSLISQHYKHPCYNDLLNLSMVILYTAS